MKSFLASQDFPYDPQYKPWFYLYMVIGMVAYDDTVFDAEGVDEYFENWARRGRKPIYGLEDWKDPVRIIKAN